MVESKLTKLVVSLGICYLCGYFNSLFVLPLIPSWFASLNKPGFLLPESYYVPLGLIVYFLLGFSLFLIWNSEPAYYHEKRLCILLFIFGLILNVSWVFAFFGLRSPFFGLMMAIFLYAILMSTAYQALKVSFGATLLLLLYLMIAFAVAYVNYSILILNPNVPYVPSFLI